MIPSVRQDFPFQGTYLDTAASAQKPRAMMHAVQRAYTHDYGNVHRSLGESTNAYEEARKTIMAFLGGPASYHLVWVPNATAGLNVLAQQYGAQLSAKDQVMIFPWDHHSNILPWRRVCQTTGAQLVIPALTSTGEICLDRVRAGLSRHTRVVSFSPSSNITGVELDSLAEVCALIRHHTSAVIIIDACQWLPHHRCDATLADFWVFSGHKMYGPTGIGGIYGHRWQDFPPWYEGGGTVHDVSASDRTLMSSPWCFEAGTPPFVQAQGWAASVTYLNTLPLSKLWTQEYVLAQALEDVVHAAGGTCLFPGRKKSICAFTVPKIHPYDLHLMLQNAGVVLRSGHHCAQPYCQALGYENGVLRASVGIYNTPEDINVFQQALCQALKVLRS